MYRSRKVNKQYSPRKSIEQLRTGKKRCPFCHPEESETVYQGNLLRIVINPFPYEFWEFMKVTDHLIIVPTRHVESLHEYTHTERSELIDVIAKYQEQGYNIYARADINTLKSIPHQHTHLLKTSNKQAVLFVYLRKPYLLFRR